MKPAGRKEQVRLVIAGAGTGGHLFPGIAVAEELVDRVPGSRVLFITTGRQVEETVLAGRPFESASISASGIKGMGLWKKIEAAAVLPKGLFQALAILRRFAPHAVLGMGAYSSAPVVAAAFLAGIPAFVHEQNRIAGMTNKWLSRFAGRVFVSFEDTDMGCDPSKIVFAGNPVRKDIRAAAEKRGRAQETGGNQRFTLLVLGGSQGAKSINHAVTEAFSVLQDPGRFRVIHQTGPADEEKVRQAYESMGVEAEVSSFFTDMAGIYRKADMAVCRAGASTVAEIAAVGLPAVFVPFPHAADDHQVLNAEGLAAEGAAEIIPEKDLSGSFLAARLEQYLGSPQRFREIKTAAEYAGRPDAASVIVDHLLEAAFGNRRSAGH